MERTQVDPSVTIENVNLTAPKMKIIATSPVAPIHRKAKLLIRCLRKRAAAAANSLALLLMVEDEMRYGTSEMFFLESKHEGWFFALPSILQIVGQGCRARGGILSNQSSLE